MKRSLAVGVLILLTSTILSAQSIQVSRENKTIYVTAEGSAGADPDFATVTVGYQNYGATKEAAYEENLKVSKRIVEALRQTKLEERQISTQKISVTRADPDEKWTSETIANRQFSADQVWVIRLSAKNAQTVVDLVLSAGANKLVDVRWGLSDRSELQAQATKNAIQKARSIAESMAAGLGARLGTLVYASNNSEIQKSGERSQFIEQFWLRRDSNLQLFPEKVYEKAMVYAVFAIE